MKKTAIVIVILAALLLTLSRSCGRKTAEEPTNARAIKVTVARPEERLFRRTALVQGTVEARNSAQPAAIVAGTIDEMLVDEGAVVKKGQPLFQIDKINLESRVQIERDNQKVAAASRAEAEAALNQAEATFKKAETDYRRFKKLFNDEKAITLDTFERAETTYKQAEAGLTHAKALVDLAAAREAQAVTSLKIAEKQLADSRVTAPFDGVITRKIKDRGDYATSGTGVLQLDDLSCLDVVFVLSADYYGEIVPGKTALLLTGTGEKPTEAIPYYKAPSLHPVTRTFEVKAGLPKATPYAPGMLCNIRIIMEEHRALGVPNAAVGRRNGQSMVFKLDNGKAVAHPVKTGLVDDGYTELLDAQALHGTDVIVEGQAFLNDQDPVRLN